MATTKINNEENTNTTASETTINFTPDSFTGTPQVKLDKFVNTLEYVVKRGVIKMKDELIAFRIGDDNTDVENNIVYIPEKLLKERNAKVYWAMFQGVGEILFNKGKLKPIDINKLGMLPEEMPSFNTQEEYADVRKQCAIDVFAYANQAFSPNVAYYLGEDIDHKAIEKNEKFKSAEELEGAILKASKIHAIRRRAMLDAANASNRKANENTTKMTRENMKKKVEDIKSSVSAVEPPKVAAGCLDEGIVDKFAKMVNINIPYRFTGFCDKVEFVYNTILNEKAGNFNKKKTVTKTEIKTRMVDDPDHPGEKKKEEYTKTKTEEVDITEAEIRHVFVTYKEYMKLVKAEYTAMNGEVLMSKYRPHKKVIINIFRYCVHKSGEVLTESVKEKIYGASIQRDVEFSIKANILGRRLMSYNERIADERERQYYIFKMTKAGAICEGTDYKKLNDRPDVKAAFELYLKKNPITLDNIRVMDTLEKFNLDKLVAEKYSDLRKEFEF